MSKSAKFEVLSFILTLICFCCVACCCQAEERFYWTGSGVINWKSFDNVSSGSKQTEYDLIDIDWDQNSGKWIAISNNSPMLHVFSIDPNQDNVQYEVNKPLMVFPRAVAVDPIGMKAYLATSTGVYVADYKDPLSSETILSESQAVRDISVDRTNRKIYWITELGAIYRASMDGSAIELLYEYPYGGAANLPVFRSIR